MSGHTPWSEIRRGLNAEELRAALRERVLAGEHPTIKATFEPDGQAWFIEVRAARAFTEARSREQIEAMARDVTAITLDVAPDSFDLTLEEVDAR